MKAWPGVLALVLGYSLVAVAQRRPAVVEAMEAQRGKLNLVHEPALPSPGDLVNRKLDAERFEALRRVALLRGALKRMQRKMEDWKSNPSVPPEGSIYRMVWDDASNALATDDRLAGAR